MRQVQYHAAGTPTEVVTCVEVADPVITRPDDVLVRVDLFPINPADVLTLRGGYPRSDPASASLGVEATGVVVETGTAVDDVRVGDRVLLMGVDNWSELRVVPAREVVAPSAGTDPRRAACLKVNRPDWRSTRSPVTRRAGWRRPWPRAARSSGTPA